jgi:hypothetical protein
MFRSAHFMALCPNCKGIRLQHGYTGTLMRLLQTGRPIEAHCVICHECWPISDQERARVAENLAGSPS